MLKYWCLATSAVIILSCSFISNQKSLGWSTQKTNGVDGENVSLDFLLLLSRHNMLMLGTKYSDNDILNKKFSNYDVCLYRSVDDGKNWNKVVLGKGKFTSYAFEDNEILAAIGMNILDETAIFDDSSKICYSSDAGINWKVISVFKDFFTRNIYISSDSTFYILGSSKDANSWDLKKTSDLGANWMQVKTIPFSYSSPVIFGETLWAVNSATKQLIKVPLRDERIENINLPAGDFMPYFISAAPQGVFVSGLSNHIPVVYKFVDNKFQKVFEIGDKDMYPLDISISDDRILLLLGRRDNIGTSYVLYWKSISGQDWVKEEVPVYYFKPYSFFDNGILGYRNGILYRWTLAH